MVDLSGAKEKEALVNDRMRREINFVMTLPGLDGENEKEVVPVKIVLQITTAEYILDPPDVETPGC